MNADPARKMGLAGIKAFNWEISGLPNHTDTARHSCQGRERERESERENKKEKT